MTDQEPHGTGSLDAESARLKGLIEADQQEQAQLFADAKELAARYIPDINAFPEGAATLTDGTVFQHKQIYLVDVHGKQVSVYYLRSKTPGDMGEDYERISFDDVRAGSEASASTPQDLSLVRRRVGPFAPVNLSSNTATTLDQQKTYMASLKQGTFRVSTPPGAAPVANKPTVTVGR